MCPGYIFSVNTRTMSMHTDQDFWTNLTLLKVEGHANSNVQTGVGQYPVI